MDSRMDKTLYDILGITSDATFDEVKKAYRKLAQMTHPDTTSGSNEAFTEVNEAYRILSNKQLRLAYDTTGSTENKTVDNKRVEAMKELQRVMLQLLEESTDDSIFYSNLPEKVLNIFNANIEKSKNVIVSTKSLIKRLRRYKKRFHYKEKDDNDFISIGINAKIYNLSGSISSEIEKIRTFELMLVLLGDYEYEPEVRTPSFSLKI